MGGVHSINAFLTIWFLLANGPFVCLQNYAFIAKQFQNSIIIRVTNRRTKTLYSNQVAVFLSLMSIAAPTYLESSKHNFETKVPFGEARTCRRRWRRRPKSSASSSATWSAGGGPFPKAHWKQNASFEVVFNRSMKISFYKMKRDNPGTLTIKLKHLFGKRWAFFCRTSTNTQIWNNRFHNKLRKLDETDWFKRWLTTFGIREKKFETII